MYNVIYLIFSFTFFGLQTMPIAHGSLQITIYKHVLLFFNKECISLFFNSYSWLFT